MESSSLYWRFPPALRIRPSVWLSALATAVLFSAYMSLASALAQASSPQPASAAPITAAPIPACTPTLLGKPSEIDLTNATTGLTVQNEPDTHYTIYGNTANQLRSQIQKCAPGENGTAEFTGETSFTLTWQYSTVSDGSVCRVTDVKVGLHTVTTTPMWQHGKGASAGLKSRWQSFMSSLTAHEAGHTALDKQYAEKILSDLNTVPPTACDSLKTLVNYAVSSDVATLNIANDKYDTSTNHGATQGAVLPAH